MHTGPLGGIWTHDPEEGNLNLDHLASGDQKDI